MANKTLNNVKINMTLKSTTTRAKLSTSSEDLAVQMGKINKWYDSLVPTGGASGNILEWDSDGVAKWVTPSFLDEKVKSTLLAQSTAEGSYRPTFVTGAGTGGVNIIDSFKVNHTPGTTSDVGNTRLVLGNATASGTANNEEGQLKLYSSGTSFHTLKGTTVSSEVIHVLPSTGGTILNHLTTTYTQTSSSSADGVYEIGKIKINGTTTTIYGHDVNTTYTATDGIKIESNVIKHTNSIATAASVFKKISYDAQGHITGTANVTKSDIPALDYIAKPGQVGSASRPIYINSSSVPKQCDTPSSGAYWTGVPYVGSNGVMEIGKYIDFHGTNASTNDYDYRISAETQTLYFAPKSSGDTTYNLIRMQSPDYNQIQFQTTKTGKAYTSTGIVAYPLTTSGQTMLIQSDGNTVVGGGESPRTLYSNSYDNMDTAENETLYLASDSSEIHFITNCQAYSGRKVLKVQDGQLVKSGGLWISARDVAPVYANKPNTQDGGYYPAWFAKTKSGGWSMGVLSAQDNLYITYTTDTDYSGGSNTNTYQVLFQNKSGTVALTSDIPTVNNASLTLKGAGTTVTTFTANASTNQSLDIVAGSNVTITPDATNHKITIASSYTNTDEKVKVTLGTTTKAYLLGTTTTPTATAQPVTSIADTGVYLDTTAGMLTATTFKAGNVIKINNSSGMEVTANTTSAWARGIEYYVGSTYTSGIGGRGDANAFSYLYMGKYDDNITRFYQSDKSTYFYGTVHLKENLYGLNPVESALNCHNSNITGINSLIFEDLSDNAGEGIMFYRSATPSWDVLWAKNGLLYFSPNYPTDSDNLSMGIFATNSNTDAWSSIGVGLYTAERFQLKIIRTGTTSKYPSWMGWAYSAAIAFGGADTKGVISVRYDAPGIMFIGGQNDSSHTKPNWNFGLTGTSGTTYNLNSMNAYTFSTVVTDGPDATSYKDYGVLYVEDPNASENNLPRKTNDFRVRLSNGTASAEGYIELILGNNKNATTAGNKGAKLSLYSSGGGWAQIIYDNTTANNTFKVPAKTAGTYTFATTSDLSGYLPLAGGDMTGTIRAASSNYYNTHIAIGVNKGTDTNDYAGLDKKNNVDIRSWYGFSISNGNSGSGTIGANAVAFSVDARYGTTYARGWAYANKFATAVGTTWVSSGYYTKDSNSKSYPLVFDNGSNLWVGAEQSVAYHHKGQTYISTGWSGTLPTTAGGTLTGNSTIFISIPTYTATSATAGSWNHVARFVLHSGNFTTTGSGNAITSAAFTDNQLTFTKGSTFALSTHTHSQYYDSTISRTANTVLAAPNGSNGSATFRKLVAADIPDLNYAGSSSAGGAATSANKLNTNDGSATNPVYFTNGVPTACNKSASGVYHTFVPSVDSEGVMEVGAYIDFHSKTSTVDYDLRLSEESTNLLALKNSSPTFRIHSTSHTNAALELWREGDNYTDYRIINMGGNFRIQSDYIEGTGHTDWFDMLFLAYTTGNATFKGTGTFGGSISSPGATFATDSFGNQLILERSGSANYASICFKNNTGILGYMGMTSIDGGLYRIHTNTRDTYLMLDSSNYTSYALPTTTKYAGSGTVGGGATTVTTVVTGGVSTGATDYGILFAANPNTAGDNNARKTYDLRYQVLEGTTSQAGRSELVLGNNKSSTTAGNKYGQISIYSASTSYHALKVADTSSAIEHTFPATSGTILNSGTTSFTRTLSSGTKIGSIKINGTSTDIYAPANTDANVTQTATTTNADYEVLFSATADNTTRTETARKNTNLKFNPSTGSLYTSNYYGEFDCLNEVAGNTSYAMVLAMNPNTHQPNTLRKTPNAIITFKNGTASEEGWAQITLGNETPSGTAGNSTGWLKLYSPSSGCHYITGASTTSAITHTLPTVGGTVLNSGNYLQYTRSIQKLYAATSTKGWRRILTIPASKSSGYTIGRYEFHFTRQWNNFPPESFGVRVICNYNTPIIHLLYAEQNNQILTDFRVTRSSDSTKIHFEVWYNDTTKNDFSVRYVIQDPYLVPHDYCTFPTETDGSSAGSSFLPVVSDNPTGQATIVIPAGGISQFNLRQVTGSYGGYFGMADAAGSDSAWIRTTSQGLLPHQSGDGTSGGHCNLGTSGWYFANAYINRVYGNTADFECFQPRHSNEFSMKEMASYTYVWFNYRLITDDKQGYTTEPTKPINQYWFGCGKARNALAKVVTSGMTIYPGAANTTSYSTTLQSASLTANRTATLPNATGTIPLITEKYNSPTSTATSYNLTYATSFKLLMITTKPSSSLFGETTVIVPAPTAAGTTKTFVNWPGVNAEAASQPTRTLGGNIRIRYTNNDTCTIDCVLADYYLQAGASVSSGSTSGFKVYITRVIGISY